MQWRKKKKKKKPRKRSGKKKENVQTFSLKVPVNRHEGSVQCRQSCSANKHSLTVIEGGRVLKACCRRFRQSGGLGHRSGLRDRTVLTLRIKKKKKKKKSTFWIFVINRVRPDGRSLPICPSVLHDKKLHTVGHCAQRINMFSLP